MAKKVFLLIILTFSIQFSTILTAKNELLLQVREKLNIASPFYLDFVQQVFDGSDMIAEESGNISYVNVNKVKWVYKDPEYKIFLINKNKYQFYDKESNQLTRGNITENKQKWIWQILFSDSITDKIKYNIDKKIIYINNSDDGVDLTIYVDGNNFPHKVVQLQGAGVKYVYYFNNYKSKYKFPAGIFDLNLPEKTEIVEME